MPVRLTDTEIADLVATPKPLPIGSELGEPRTTRRGHREAFRNAETPRGFFQIRVRQNPQNPFDFSAILLYRLPGTNVFFRLRRYNGNSHDHTNAIEGNVIEDQFHIHYATERYQERDLREDGYAEATSRFGDLSTAIDCLALDCKVLLPSGSKTQRRLSEFFA